MNEPHIHHYTHIETYFDHNTQEIYDLFECACGAEKTSRDKDNIGIDE